MCIVEFGFFSAILPWLFFCFYYLNDLTGSSHNLPSGIGSSVWEPEERKKKDLNAGIIYVWLIKTVHITLDHLKKMKYSLHI